MLGMGEGGEKIQIIVLVVIAVVLTVALYFTVYKAIADENTAKAATLESHQADVRNLRPYVTRMPELDRQIDSLRQQLELTEAIVPEEKAADEFMRVMQDTADASGVEVRRYTAKPLSTKDFYTEVPFDIELDGSYYSMLNFFDHVAKLERIVNVTNLQVGSMKSGAVHTLKSYDYSPNESVVATCTTSTFFSNETNRAKKAKKLDAKSDAKAGGKPDAKSDAKTDTKGAAKDAPVKK